MLTGTCLCGDVAWEIDGPITLMANCHCTVCRKAHGTAFATFVTFAPEHFRWLRGEANMGSWSASPGAPRNFCRQCGSKLPSLAPFPVAFAGPMTGDWGDQVVTDHICVASKAPWYTIHDGATQHDGLPPGTGQTIATPRHTEPAPGKIRGGCLCGRVAYEIDGPLVTGGIVFCHCSRCRRARGAPHGANMPIASEHFRFLRGEDAVASYKVPDAERYAQFFCRDCGSPTPANVPIPFRMVPAGSLDDDPGVRPAVHIMLGSKAEWFVVPPDDLARADTYPTTPNWAPIARAVSIGLSDGAADLDGILALQRQNLEASVGADEAAREGFVTVVHTREALAAMHALCPSIVARVGKEVVGYALVMPLECRAFVPILEPMFDKLATLDLGGARAYIMGQVCIAKSQRGRGIFDSLYAAHRTNLSHRFDLCVTEVAVRNARSLRAHERVGFERLLTYRDATDEWALIGLRLDRA